MEEEIIMSTTQIPTAHTPVLDVEDGRWRASDNRDDAAGVKPGASPADRMTVNVGTVRAPFPVGCPARVAGVDRCVACRRAWTGRSRRSTRRSGKPAAWGRTA